MSGQSLERSYRYILAAIVVANAVLIGVLARLALSSLGVPRIQLASIVSLASVGVLTIYLIGALRRQYGGLLRLVQLAVGLTHGSALWMVTTSVAIVAVGFSAGPASTTAVDANAMTHVEARLSALEARLNGYSDRLRWIENQGQRSQASVRDAAVLVDAHSSRELTDLEVQQIAKLLQRIEALPANPQTAEFPDTQGEIRSLRRNQAAIWNVLRLLRD